MRIMYKPKYHMSEIIHINSSACSKQYEGIEVWKYGEIKNIPDDLKFRENIAGQVHYVKLIDDLLSDNAFKIVKEGINPNFICSICGVETLQEVIRNPDITNENGIPLEIDGKRVCENCFRNPPNKEL